VVVAVGAVAGVLVLEQAVQEFQVKVMLVALVATVTVDLEVEVGPVA
jgi:hypothetical protein